MAALFIIRRGVKMIRIENLKLLKDVEENEIIIRVDRSSPLGNPFYLKDESHRDEVCDKYQEYFDNIVSNPNDNKEFMDELRRIYKLSKKYDVILGCWCYPKRCHAQTILNFLNQYVK